MSSVIAWDLVRARRLIEDVEEKLKEAPELEAIVELLDAVEKLDNNYRDCFCHDCDLNWGEEPGTTYEGGTSMEFYIESDWWHDVSMALRKLRDRTIKEDI